MHVYRIIAIVLFGPFGLGLDQGHGESVCVPLYYLHKVNTLRIYVRTVHVYIYTTSLNHAYPH